MKSRATVPLQRVGPLAGLAGLLAELGVSAGSLPETCGLSPSDLTPEAWLPLDDLLALLEQATAVTGRPDLALRLGLRHDHRALGLVGRLADTAPTLGVALTDFVTWQLGNSHGLAAFLHPFGNDLALGVGLYRGAVERRRYAYDVSIGIGVAMIRELSGGRVSPSEILVCMRAPAHAGRYEAVLGVPVRFDQDQCSAILPKAALDTPNPHADPRERQRLLAQLEDAFDRMASTEKRLRHMLRPMLMTGQPSVTAAAERLGIQPRTLARRLARESTSFDTVRDEVRFEVARELLELTNLPVGDIADALAYASHSSFVHAFRRWGGTSPSDWRKRRP